MNRERTEALFAEIVVLVEKLDATISEAKRIQDFNVDTQHLEKMLRESKAVEQRLHAAEQASFLAIRKAGWLSTKSIVICALSAFLIAIFIGSLGGLYLAKKETKALLDEQRQEEIARFSTQLANANVLVEKLDEVGVRFYSDMIAWNKDSEDIIIGNGNDKETNEELKYLRINED